MSYILNLNERESYVLVHVTNVELKDFNIKRYQNNLE